MEEEVFFSNDKDYVSYYYDRLLTEYLSVLYSSGLNRQDYEDISKIVRKLDKIRSEAYNNHFKYVNRNHYVLDMKNNNMVSDYKNKEEQKRRFLLEIEDIRGHFEKILKLISENIKPDTIEQYLKEEVSLTHLVFTNNKGEKIKLYSNDSFMFLCQYHSERTPSLGVVNYKGYGNCFGCGWSFTIFSYLNKIEQLNLKKAVRLLAKVYMIDIENNTLSENDELVQKYRNSLLSLEFRRLLERAYERTSKKEKNITNSLALSRFEKDMATIDRISRGEHVTFVKEMDKGKTLKLTL